MAKWTLTKKPFCEDVAGSRGLKYLALTPPTEEFDRHLLSLGKEVVLAIQGERQAVQPENIGCSLIVHSRKKTSELFHSFSETSCI